MFAKCNVLLVLLRFAIIAMCAGGMTACEIQPKGDDPSGFAAGYLAGLASQSTETSFVKRNNGLTRGSTNTGVVIYGSAVEAAGADQPTYQSDSTLGDSFVVNKTGIYSVTADSHNTGAHTISIHVSSPPVHGSFS